MATLASYITECRRLLHDANSNFWTDVELTDYINDARERVVRDTGALRTLQVSATPIGANGSAAIPWNAATAVTAGQYVFSNIFTYVVVTSGITGTSAPPYPGTTSYPPSTPFADGTATLQYYAPAEVIPYSALPQGNQTLDVMNINIFWGNSRIPLRYLPWTNFNAQLRYWQNYVGRPVCFSIFGQQQIYIAPVPDQSYTMELDTVILPTALSLATPNAVDAILDPYTTPVAFYACYKAKYKEQSYGEAEIYKQEYIKHTNSVLNSVFTRRIPDPYSSPY
jgi:hypothetical protein